MGKRKVWALLCLLAVIMCQSSFAQLKRRIAVFSFEDKTSHRYAWWSGGTPGEGMADMLITALVKQGSYTVMERQEISKIMEEQNLGQTGRVTQQSAADIGKLLGVELAVFGAVTEYGYSKERKGGRFKGVGIGVQKQTATVAVDIHIVNTATGEILAAENVRKEEISGGLSLATKAGRFSDRQSFDKSLVGKATRNAVNEIVTLIDSQMEALPWNGKVILVKGTVIYIKPGSDSGVNVGDTFSVFSEGEELIDPDTGLSLGTEEKKIATITVTELITGGKAAKARITSGSGVKTGDIIKQQ